MTRAQTAALVLMCFVPTVSAQTPSIAEEQSPRARQLLRSQVWSEKAWGAYIASQLPTAEMNAPLVEQLRVYNGSRTADPGSAEHAFVSVLLDAAIQSSVVVPPPVLEPFRDDAWVGPFLILAERTANADLVLPLASHPVNVVWLAANNLLYGWRSHEWYQGLLAEIAPTHRFRVVDKLNSAGASGAGGAGMCGDGVFGVPEGFPPVALYVLEAEPYRESVVLAKGPRTVYYHRSVATTEKQAATGSCAMLFDRMEIRIGYLAELSNRDPASLERVFHASSDIVVPRADLLPSLVAPYLEVQLHEIAGVLKTIHRIHGLTAPGTLVTINVEIIDERSNRSDALPVVQPKTVNTH